MRRFLWLLPFLLAAPALGQTLLAELPERGAIGPAGDFDGDGFDDFQVGERIYSGLDLSILFEAQDPAGSTGASTVLNDWDGDAVPDYAYVGVPSTQYKVVSGATGQVVHVGCVNSPFCASIIEIRNAGDTNGDGLDDLVFWAYGWCDDDVIVYQNGGDGSGEVAITYFDLNTFRHPSGLGDLDGDGLAEWGFFDLNDGGVRVWDPPGTIKAPYGNPINPSPPAVAPVGDVDGDGRDDVLVSANGPVPWTRVVSGADYWTVLLQLPFYEFLAGPGDLDCDGVPDLLVGTDDPGPDGGLVELRSGVDGAVLWSVTGAPGDRLGRVAPAGDLNGDGVPDWLVGADAYTRVYLGAAPVSTYCTGKPTSAGCTPAIDSGGAPSLSGADDFLVLTRDSLANRPGLFFFGTSGPAAVPFLGGTLCAAPPLTRTPVQLSSGGADCRSGYAFFFDQALAASQGFAGGDAAWGQFWMRDPDQADGTGVALTDAITWTWCP